MPTSADWVRDVYSQRAKPGALLVTISPDGLDEPIRVTDEPGGLTVGTGDDAVFYQFAPFGFTWGGAGADQPSRGSQLEIGASGELVELVRLGTGRPPVVIERVRVAAPGVAEKALRGRVVTQCEVSGGSVKVSIGGTDLGDEYAVKASYTMGRTPGLF